MKENSRKYYGIGIRDTDSTITSNGNRCPFFDRWLQMLKRCYCTRYQANKPTYVGCYVTPEWHLLSNFQSWMASQDWKGKQLDKDIIIPGNKIYSPLTCRFISAKVNNLISNRISPNSSKPAAKYQDGYKYRATIKIDHKSVHLGSFDTQREAREAYLLKKIELIEDEAMQSSDEEISRGLLRHVEILRMELRGNPTARQTGRRVWDNGD